MTDARCDVVVVGGGLAGLAAAATAARAGRSVVVLDGRSDPGGRARSELHDGFTFNQGAHALYRAGRGKAVLSSLGVTPKGSMPRLRGSGLTRDGQLFGAVSSDAVSPLAWERIARFLGPGARGRAEGLSAAEWIDTCPNAAARAGLGAAVRVSTYLADHDRADAVAVLTQVRRAARGVDYLDGGWQQLVDSLLAVASSSGVRVIGNAKVTAVGVGSDGVAVTHTGGTTVAGSVVLAAGGPAQAARLLDGASPTVDRWAADAQPVVAACLDLALRRLPASRRGLVLGLDEPTYLNLHTPAARLAPEGGGELLSLMRYSADRDPDVDHRATLEAQADLVYPGWRDELVHAQYGRHLIVAHDRPRPRVDPADRPAVVVPELATVFLAGDWITTEGMLADAALASAHAAGRAAATVEIRRPRAVPATPVTP